MLLSMREKQATCKYAVDDGGAEPVCGNEKQYIRYRWAMVCRGCDQYEPKEGEQDGLD